jgi:hypothetical protein
LQVLLLLVFFLIGFYRHDFPFSFSGMYPHPPVGGIEKV